MATKRQLSDDDDGQLAAEQQKDESFGVQENKVQQTTVPKEQVGKWTPGPSKDYVENLKQLTAEYKRRLDYIIQKKEENIRPRQYLKENQRLLGEVQAALKTCREEIAWLDEPKRKYVIRSGPQAAGRLVFVSQLSSASNSPSSSSSE